MSKVLTAPFPWFGGKSRASQLIWARFGSVQNYVEPFAGSLAVLLGRPGTITGPETVNDLDGLLVNFWRAVRNAPELVALHADWPVAELDLHARHVVLVEKRGQLTQQLQADPHYYDATLAGWWVWGACAWIGSGWCSGQGPWQRQETAEGLRLVKVDRNAGTGINRKLPHLGDAGTGINRQLPHLGDAGTGINRQLPHLGDAGKGDWLASLAARLRTVRVACGDWQRVCGPSVTTKHGTTGLLLDPPYNSDGAENDCYGVAHSNVADEVRRWCLVNGADPKLRIALCGYASDHDELLAHGWTVEGWKARKGYQSDGDNSARERIWFSPACLRPQPGLFDALA
ncbi:MAG: DNA adenine methylase [Janthinobacterium lividum]